MIFPRRPLLCLSLLLVIAIFPGCFRSPNVTLWTLSPTPTNCIGEITSGDAISVRVEPIHFPEYLDDPRMTRRTGEHQITRDEFNRWAEDLRTMFSRILIQNLSCKLHSSNVFSAEEYPQRSAQRFVILSIERFEASHARDVSLVAVWGIASSQTELNASPLHRVTLSTVPPDDSPNAHAAALSSLINELARHLEPSLGVRKDNS